MASDEPFSSPPPPYFLPGHSPAGSHVGIYHISPPLDARVCPGATHLSLLSVSPLVSPPPPSPPRPKFVNYEMELCQSPALTFCLSCQTQVMTRVTYRAGRFSWTMCLVFVVCGLFLCCCLLPFVLKSFKDVLHSCPRCCRVLHVHRKTCCS